MSRDSTFPTPPAPGPWFHDVTHHPLPLPAIYAKMVCEEFPKGWAEGAREHAYVIQLHYWNVDGWVYWQPRPLGGPPGGAPPPREVFEKLFDEVPPLVALKQKAAALFDERPWRAALSRWTEQDRPWLEAAYGKLQSADPESLDDAALASHLEQSVDLLRKAVHLHGVYTVPSTFPFGDFFARVSEWAGVDAGKAALAAAGHARASTGWSDEHQAVYDAIRVHPDALALLQSGAPAEEVLRTYRERTDEVGQAYRAFESHFGHRLATGYDFTQPRAIEVPERLVDAFRKGPPTPAYDSEKVASELRAAVPEASRGDFDLALTEARHVARLRDERSLYTDVWANGVLRIGLLELGRRLAAKGTIDAPDHVFELEESEIRGAALGTTNLREQLASRARSRAERARAGTPPMVGDAPKPPPPAEWFPGPLARAVRASFAVEAALYRDASEDGAKGETIRGIGVSSGSHTGTARVLRVAEDLERIRPGDVLVAPITSPALTMVLPLLGAIVTDRGGALSHAAIVTREYGIPGVVGTRDATKRIADGNIVRVDGDSGEVTILK